MSRQSQNLLICGAQSGLLQHFKPIDVSHPRYRFAPIHGKSARRKSSIGKIADILYIFANKGR